MKAEPLPEYQAGQLLWMPRSAWHPDAKRQPTGALAVIVTAKPQTGRGGWYSLMSVEGKTLHSLPRDMVGRRAKVVRRLADVWHMGNWADTRWVGNHGLPDTDLYAPTKSELADAQEFTNDAMRGLMLGGFQ